MSSKGVGVEVLPELFRVALYKSRQGRLVRRATFICLALLTGFGAIALAGQLQGVSEYVRIGVPLLVWAACCWVSFRAVNVPKFADFLISVEAEMNKVSWPSRTELIRSSMVVIFMMFFLALVLFGFDVIWQQLFRAIGVLA